MPKDKDKTTLPKGFITLSSAIFDALLVVNDQDPTAIHAEVDSRYQDRSTILADVVKEETGNGSFQTQVDTLFGTVTSDTTLAGMLSAGTIVSTGDKRKRYHANPQQLVSWVREQLNANARDIAASADRETQIAMVMGVAAKQGLTEDQTRTLLELSGLIDG